MTWFNKNVAVLFSKERLTDGECNKLLLLRRKVMSEILPVLPSLLDDIHHSLSVSMPAKEGRIDPFRNVYDVGVTHSN
jgi:hypothetical protein